MICCCIMACSLGICYRDSYFADAKLTNNPIPFLSFVHPPFMCTIALVTTPYYAHTPSKQSLKGGNSGSPVVHEETGLAIGIHTHGGCSKSGGANSGTKIYGSSTLLGHISTMTKTCTKDSDCDDKVVCNGTLRRERERACPVVSILFVLTIIALRTFLRFRPIVEQVWRYVILREYAQQAHPSMEMVVRRSNQPRLRHPNQRRNQPDLRQPNRPRQCQRPNHRLRHLRRCNLPLSQQHLRRNQCNKSRELFHRSCLKRVHISQPRHLYETVR